MNNPQIAAFFDKYWAIEYKTNLDKFTLQQIKEELQKKTEKIEKKYSVETRNLELESRLKYRYTRDVKDTEEYNDILFRTGMYSDIIPNSDLCERETLRVLSKRLNNTINSGTILYDLGCGNGRISLGLMMLVPHIEKMYLNDISTHALNETKKNINRFLDDGMLSSDKDIELYKEDIIDEKFEKNLQVMASKGNSVLLISQPQYWGHQVWPICQMFVNSGENNRAFYCHSTYKPLFDEDAPQIRDVIEQDNIRYTIVDSKLMGFHEDNNGVYSHWLIVNESIRIL